MICQPFFYGHMADSTVSRNVRRIPSGLRWLLVATAGLVAVAGVSWAAGSWIAQPQRHSVGPVPGGWNAQSVEIGSQEGLVRGWYADGKPGRGAVLLLHGVRADRRAMVPRARALHERGYAVLLIDLYAHGESDGDMIGVGPKEAAGIRSALDWMRDRLPSERLGVIGASLGGAGLLLAHQGRPPDAVVLEAVFTSIETAVDNRVRERVGPLAAAVSPLLLGQMPMRLGVAPDQVRPVDHMAQLAAPVLVAGGAEDRYTTQAETEHMFAVAAEPKQLWVVPGAGHVDLYRFAPQAYEAQVFGFLSRYLQKQ